MKKLLIALMMVMAPMMVQSKSYVTKLQGTETNVYEDSLIYIKFYVYDNLYKAYILFQNKSEKRMVLEWDNVRINSSRIAFTKEMVFEVNTPKPDETLPAHGATGENVCLRFHPVIPICHKDQIKEKGCENVSLYLSYKIDDKLYEKRLEFYVYVEKKK